jgi:hypothetical protein
VRIESVLFIGFQVKYSRDPSSATEREAVIGLIRTEKNKVENLKARGLSSYYFLTNVRGTAHLDTGSIDRANEELTAQFGIPAHCYWRDDIERRLDANHDVKWSFPSILRGADLLKDLLSGDLGEAGQRRKFALKAYITTQFSLDEEVKFKQVELQNKLLDLFIDVPVRMLDVQGDSRSTQDLIRGLDDPIEQGIMFGLISYRVAHEGSTMCASTVFLQSKHLPFLSRVILEGAPGQGKSTITQYICQVHRIGPC